MNGLVEKIGQQALSTPEAIAIRSRDKRVSYAELVSAVQQATAQLRSLQVESLGLYLDNGIDWIVFDLAALAAGIRVVPLPWFFSQAQITHAIADGNLDSILFDLALPHGVIGSGTILQGYSDSRLQRIAAPGEQLLCEPCSPAKVSYTSGSTGTPRGIELGADFIEETAQSICCAIGHLGIESHLSILPYATLLENIAGVYVPLLLGRCVYAEPSADIGLSVSLGLDPLKLQVTFNRVRPESLIVTPQLLDVLCLLVESAALNHDCLRFVAVGGARVAPDLLQRARDLGIPAYEGYGLTEFASVATLNTTQDDRIGSVGKPLPGVMVTIAEDGEICLESRFDTPAAETAQSQRIFVRSGDYGRIDSAGFVYVHGRKSNLIVLANGRNVSPEWIESEFNASPLVTQSYVFSEFGDRVSALLATTATDAEVETEITRINDALPAYARVAEWHRLATPFSCEQQTLTANGRLRRSQIRQRLPELRQTVAPLSKDRSAVFSLQETNHVRP
ncbi:MAG: long-chain fatty acid--CoA ligase [Gammaproteobacteria bacterium]|nr:long-chain fatty acid--CoA ligase [Gammaproteobacteria bacterium]